MTEQARNKAALRDMLAATDAGDLDAVVAFYSPDYVDHDASESRGGDRTHASALRPAFARFYSAFSGTRHVLEDMVAEGDRVAARISVEAKHTGEILGIAATGQVIRNESLVIYRFEEGRIRERWCRERYSTRDLLEAAARVKAGVDGG
jgi:C-1 hydroxylase